eukprot:gene23458-1449_t
MQLIIEHDGGQNFGKKVGKRVAKYKNRSAPANKAAKVFANGEYVKANKFYSRAILSGPKNHALFSNRSACHFNARDFDEAAADAYQAIKLKPDWVKGYWRLTAALEQLKDFTAADKWCTE